MGKRIIFCADGTWDDEKDNSNVYKLFTSIPITAEQIAFYDQGVGTEGSALDKLLGGAFGEGLFQKIKDGYTKISHVYEPGDEIFIFGFSRGAYVARSLAGMITACGVPAGAFDDKTVETAFEAYRDKDNRQALLDGIKDKGLDLPKIKMIGVWDTVGALGIPALFGGVDPIKYGFLDTALSPNVENAYQALSIDEHRREFPPTLWDKPKTPVAGQTVEQVWFAGAHSDVGGGYPASESGLSDITLGWMMKKAAALGVAIEPATYARYTTLDAKYALSEVHKSWSVLWGFPRDRAVPADAVLADSVALRALHDKTYRPDNLNFTRAGALAGSYSIAPVLPPAPAIPPALGAKAAGGGKRKPKGPAR